jgi:hypothetical protein
VHCRKALCDQTKWQQAQAIVPSYNRYLGINERVSAIAGDQLTLGWAGPGSEVNQHQSVIDLLPGSGALLGSGTREARRRMFGCSVRRQDGTAGANFTCPKRDAHDLMRNTG